MMAFQKTILGEDERSHQATRNGTLGPGYVSRMPAEVHSRGAEVPPDPFL